MPGPFDDVLADLCRLQIKRLREQPTPGQLRKCRARLGALVGVAPPRRLAPLFQRLRRLEDDFL
ncbi:hypothetical protein [Methyloparacoccus murrellii]